MTTSKTRAMTLLGVAFLAGGIVGGAFMRFIDDGGRRGVRHSTNCAVESRRVCAWAEELTLTTDQQEELLAVYRAGEVRTDSIRSRIRPAIDSAYQSIRPAVDSQRQTLRQEVRQHLTTQQGERYDSIVNAYDQARRDRRDHPFNGNTPRARTP